jgi:predicted  nucleic acid-binding Zn-ribbon protein
MALNAPQSENLSKEPAATGGGDGNATPATDEDILRLRSRLDREFAVVTQKLVDAEAAIIDVEIALRTCETASRTRLPAVPSGTSEKGTERITARLGLARIKEWVSKPGAKEGETADSAGANKPSSELRPLPKGTGDIEDRMDEALRTFSNEIREREREATELDRKLHDARKELIRLRATEQEARENQSKYNQTKELREQLERQLSQLNESVRTIETSLKTDTGIRQKPKDPALGPPKPEDPMASAIDHAHKAVAAQEKKLADLEKEVERANTGLVEERARQQRIRGMQIRLKQARYFSTDLQRALGGLASTLEELRQRASSLLRPDAKASREGVKPAARPPEARVEAPASKPS